MKKTKNNIVYSTKNTYVEKSSKKNNTKIVSFRLPVHIINQISMDAKNNNLTMNSMVSKLLTKYVQWDVNANEMEMVPVPKFVLEQLSDGVKIDHINKLTEQFYEFVKEWVVFTKGEYEFESSTKFLIDYMNASGFTTGYVVEGNIHRFTIRHKLGLRWSILFEDLFTKIFNDFSLGEKPKFSITPSTVKISITLHDNLDIGELA